MGHAAPLLVVVLIVSNNRHLMGDYVNGHVANILGWITFSLMAAASIALFATEHLLLMELHDFRYALVDTMLRLREVARRSMSKVLRFELGRLDPASL